MVEVARVLNADRATADGAGANGAQQFASRRRARTRCEQLIVGRPRHAVAAQRDPVARRTGSRSGRSGPLIEHPGAPWTWPSAAFSTTLADDVIELAHGGNRLVDERPMPVLAFERAQGRGRSGAAARYREAHRTQCQWPRGRRPRRTPRRGRSRAAEPHDERGQVHGAGLGHNHMRAPLADEARVLRDRHGPRHSGRRASDAVRSVQAASEPQRVRVRKRGDSDSRSASSSSRRWVGS